MWKKAVSYSLATALTLTAGVGFSVSEADAAVDTEAINRVKAEAGQTARSLPQADDVNSGVAEKASRAEGSVPANAQSVKERGAGTVRSVGSKAGNLKDEAPGAAEKAETGTVAEKTADVRSQAAEVAAAAPADERGTQLHKSVDSREAEEKVESTTGKDQNIPNLFTGIFLDIQTGFAKMFG